ncbi:MAG: SUMF1/EgtB/PvdO family nonheme iron enzyme, partial [Prevotella sp.]|nr:SUMF1/EgtB/PvdO family nonheme iron enzyme [Prevotella sp.]
EELCQDWYGDYSSAAQTNPTGASSGTDRVSRGGSRMSYAKSCRSSNRGFATPGSIYDSVGLRLALSE